MPKPLTEPEEVVDAHFKVLKVQHEGMKRIRRLRNRREGGDPRLWRIYREAVDFYLKHVDPETGLLPQLYPSRTMRALPVEPGFKGRIISQEEADRSWQQVLFRAGAKALWEKRVCETQPFPGSE